MNATLLPAVALVTLVAVTGCGRNSPGHFSNADLKVSTNVTRFGEIPADLGSIEVINRFGEVRITGTETNATGWTWRLTARARTEESAREAAEAATCTVERVGDQLRVVVRLPDTGTKWSFASDLDLVVPAKMSVRMRNGFGRSEISGLDGDLDAGNEHGELEVREAKGNVVAATSFARLTVTGVGPAKLRNQHGSVEVSDVAGDLEAETSFSALTASDVHGMARLRNQHGNIELSGATGAEARTSFGALSVVGITGDAGLKNEHGRVEAKVSGSVQAATTFASMEVEAGGPVIECQGQHGSVQITAVSDRLARLEARNSFGAIRVQLPAALQPAIRAETSFGSIESDFPVILPPKGADPFAEVGEETSRIILHNQNGDIRVVKE